MTAVARKVKGTDGYVLRCNGCKVLTDWWPGRVGEARRIMRERGWTAGKGRSPNLMGGVLAPQTVWDVCSVCNTSEEA